MDERWVWASVALVGGLLIASFAALIVRRSLGREARRLALRKIAGPLSLFTFWTLTAAAILVAIAVSSPETLKPIPTDILDWLPNAALAGLLVIGGYALALSVSLALGRLIERGTGERHRSLEQVVRTAVVLGAAILALSQIGVDTTILNILIAAAAFGIAAALAGISIAGSRRLATHIVSGRALRPTLAVGRTIKAGDVEGSIIDQSVTHLVVATEHGRLHVPWGLLIDQPILIPDEVND